MTDFLTEVRKGRDCCLLLLRFRRCWVFHDKPCSRRRWYRSVCCASSSAFRSAMMVHDMLVDCSLEFLLLLLFYSVLVLFVGSFFFFVMRRMRSEERKFTLITVCLPCLVSLDTLVLEKWPSQLEMSCDDDWLSFEQSKATSNNDFVFQDPITCPNKVKVSH